MPLPTILIVGGSWVILLVLTVLYYRRTRNRHCEPSAGREVPPGETSREPPTRDERDGE